jgi:hypothetical protein
MNPHVFPGTLCVVRLLRRPILVEAEYAPYRRPTLRFCSFALNGMRVVRGLKNIPSLVKRHSICHAIAAQRDANCILTPGAVRPSVDKYLQSAETV